MLAGPSRATEQKLGCPVALAQLRGSADLGTPIHTQALLFSGIAIPENGFICGFITKDSWAQDHIGRDRPKMSFGPRFPDTRLEYLLHFKGEKLKRRGPYTTEENFLENLSCSVRIRK